MSEQEKMLDTDGAQADRTDATPIDEQVGQLPSFLEGRAPRTPDDQAPSTDGDDGPAAQGRDPIPIGEEQGPEETDQPEQGAISSAAASVGSFLSEGVASVKAMSAARRAHAEAREELQKLENTIDERERELEHRRDVENRYADILEEQRVKMAAAEQAARDAKELREEVAAQAEALKLELKQVCEEDAATERRLKAALDSAADREKSARESGRRLQNKLDDAKSDLERLNEERRASLIAAEQAVSSAQKRLDTLNIEYAELQRNPSANSAGYSVRSRELELEISDAAAELREVRENLPIIDRETQHAIDEAVRAIDEAQKPIPTAKATYEEAAAAADRARDAHAAAKEDAEARQKELRQRIAEKNKAAKERERERETSLREAADARALIDEAEEIHAHPEVTKAIDDALAADRAEADDRRAEVSALADEERSTREKTRASRLKFGAAIAATLLVIALLVAWALLS